MFAYEGLEERTDGNIFPSGKSFRCSFVIGKYDTCNHSVPLCIKQGLLQYKLRESGLELYPPGISTFFAFARIRHVEPSELAYIANDVYLINSIGDMAKEIKMVIFTLN